MNGIHLYVFLSGLVNRPLSLSSPSPSGELITGLRSFLASRHVTLSCAASASYRTSLGVIVFICRMTGDPWVTSLTEILWKL